MLILWIVLAAAPMKADSSSSRWQPLAEHYVGLTKCLSSGSCKLDDALEESGRLESALANAPPPDADELRRRVASRDPAARAAALAVMSVQHLQDESAFRAILDGYPSEQDLVTRRLAASALASLSPGQVNMFASAMVSAFAGERDALAIVFARPALSQLDKQHALELFVALMKAGTVEIREIVRVMASDREDGFMETFKHRLAEAGAQEGLKTITDFEATKKAAREAEERDSKRK